MTRPDRIVIDDPHAAYAHIAPPPPPPAGNLLTSASRAAIARCLPRIIPVPQHGQIAASVWGDLGAPVDDLGWWRARYLGA
jgi:hypothetical protein